VNFVYILECNDGTLYTGWTTNIEKRLREHNKGKGSKYTRARYPVVLKYLEEFEDKREALKRECFIKRLSRIDKINLIRNGKEKASLNID
jgi:putative endonuclease